MEYIGRFGSCILASWHTGMWLLLALSCQAAHMLCTLYIYTPFKRLPSPFKRITKIQVKYNFHPQINAHFIFQGINFLI